MQPFEALQLLCRLGLFRGRARQALDQPKRRAGGLQAHRVCRVHTERLELLGQGADPTVD